MTILPMKELKDTAGIAKRCEETNEPIHITKNGYDCLVVMTSKTFEQYDRALKQAAKRELAREKELEETVASIRAGLDDIAAGRTRDAFELIDELREKYGL
ncbi:hypothetical protein [Enorma sp.]|uniref:hypothetical protein n=1 Tax=Enorma sp. TaxID=1920692 RepID=UPI003AB27DF9